HVCIRRHQHGVARGERGLRVHDVSECARNEVYGYLVHRPLQCRWLKHRKAIRSVRQSNAPPPATVFAPREHQLCELGVKRFSLPRTHHADGLVCAVPGVMQVHGSRKRGYAPEKRDIVTGDAIRKPIAVPAFVERLYSLCGRRRKAASRTHSASILGTCTRDLPHELLVTRYAKGAAKPGHWRRVRRHGAQCRNSEREPLRMLHEAYARLHLSIVARE